jgi:uncharacterized protein with PIN domain
MTCPMATRPAVQASLVRAIGSHRSAPLDRREAQIQLMPASVAQTTIAGRSLGRGVHPVRLNFGECIATARANETSEPRLFRGNDFARTDIGPALKD